jgi:alpha-ribazole phosphatase
MRIYLIRHAQTEGNALKRYIGVTDSPLSKDGIAMAQAAGGDSELKSVIVTPLSRTQHTARILFPNAEQRIESGITEMDFGDFENRSADDMVNDADYRAWVDGNCLGRCPNGESIAGFSERVTKAFWQCVRRAEDEGEERLVFVVHGGVIMALMSVLGRPKKSFYDWYLPNCACVQADTAKDAETGEEYLDNVIIKENVSL